jgi:hypothetical protein
MVLAGTRSLPIPPRPRHDGSGAVCLRCADFREHPACVALISGTDAGEFLESLRVHLRDVHGVTPIGFMPRRDAVIGPLLAALAEHDHPTTEER